LVAALAWTVGCPAPAQPARTNTNPLLGLPALPVAEAVPAARIELGRKLFNDKTLSRDGSVSCASCHDPKRAFSDGKAVSTGIGGASGTRNAPSLLNVAYATSLFWDGRRTSLEQQVADPFTNAREFGLADQQELIARVLRSREYRALLAQAFPESAENWRPEHLFGALAAYLRGLRAGDSAFDRYYYAGDQSALEEPARRGLQLFKGRAGCSECHSIGSEGALFTDHGFHGAGLGTPEVAPRLPELTKQVYDLTAAQIDAIVVADRSISALGRFLVTKDPRDIGKYKTPSLRNVALTAPYMHDGSASTLREAVDYEIYYRGRASNRPPTLTLLDRDDLVAFLNALTSSCVMAENCPGE
jgi:cytochrome c peroxidase